MSPQTVRVANGASLRPTTQRAAAASGCSHGPAGRFDVTSRWRVELNSARIELVERRRPTGPWLQPEFRSRAPRWASALRVVAILFLFCFAARAELQWTKPAQDFQATPDQGKIEAHFAFKNTGTTTVTVKSITTSCGCTTATLDKKVYQPGEGGEIVAVYKFPFQHGALRKLVTVVTDDHPKEPVVLDIRVFVHEPFEVKPALVYWRTGAPADAKTVQLLADGYPVHIKSVTSSNPRITATLQTVKAGEEYTVAIKPADTAQKEAAEISVLTDFPAGAPHTYTIHARIK